jgi:hypothetical protein
MKTLEDLTVEEVTALLDYDHKTGVFRWVNCAGRWGRIPAGSRAGTPNKEGYRYICINGRHYRACRLAFLIMTGEWPKHQVDHINRDTGDDRWENLREAKQTQNKANSKRYKNNTTGFKGVTFDAERMKFTVRIRDNGTYRRLGRFDTAEEAHEAYKKATKQKYGEFANAG